MSLKSPPASANERHARFARRLRAPTGSCRRPSRPPARCLGRLRAQLGELSGLFQVGDDILERVLGVRDADHVREARVGPARGLEQAGAQRVHHENQVDDQDRPQQGNPEGILQLLSEHREADPQVAARPPARIPPAPAMRACPSDLGNERLPRVRAHVIAAAIRQAHQHVSGRPIRCWRPRPVSTSRASEEMSRSTAKNVADSFSMSSACVSLPGCGALTVNQTECGQG
jgi:hypothetical protein